MGVDAEAGFLEKVSKRIYATKKHLTKDLRSFQNAVYKIFSFLVKDEDSKVSKGAINEIYAWVKGFKIGSSDKEINVELRDYFEELETLQNALEQVKSLADDMAEANR